VILAGSAISLDLVNSAVGAAGLLLASASLTWQAITWRQSGALAKIELLQGAVASSGAAYVTLPASSSAADVGLLAEQGFPERALFVVLSNTGRLALTVERLTVLFPGNYRVAQLTFLLGPKLPCRLDSGEPGTWGVDIRRIEPLLQVLRTSGKRNPIRVRVELTLGNGRTIVTRQRAEL
jgi:hypothetical protein